MGLEKRITFAAALKEANVLSEILRLIFWGVLFEVFEKNIK